MKKSYSMLKNGLTLTLALVMVCSLLSSCGGKSAPKAQDAPAAVSTAEPASVDTNQTEQNAEPAYGTLIDKGIGLNENYFADVSFFGTASDLTDSSFVLGKESMAFHGSEPYLEQITIHYGENTLVRTAVIQGDTYKIYAASQDDLQKFAGVKYRFDIVLEDPDADELWAKEIRIVRLFN